MQYTISAAAFLAIIILVRLRRPTHSRSRVDEAFTVFSSVTFGVLIAATPWGHAIVQFVSAILKAIR
ncbi:MULTISPECIES: hypothetical protein [Kitasatospora]|uniref:Uncharacterized protein n=1 Tax=Kitasatospora cystarginea TaxID=58350 RepID=A0ABP5RYA4_9ACTN